MLEIGSLFNFVIVYTQQYTVFAHLPLKPTNNDMNCTSKPLDFRFNMLQHKVRARGKFPAMHSPDYSKDATVSRLVVP